MSKLTGGIMQAAGILIAGASGLCSLVFLVSILSDGGSESIGFLPLVLLFGGIPLAIGLALFAAGRKIVRRAQERDQHDIH